MTQRLSSDPVTVAAAVQGAFAIMAARIEARQDSRLLVDNELVVSEAFELVSLMLARLEAGLGTPSATFDSSVDGAAPAPGEP